MKPFHKPVLCAELLEYLKPANPDALIIDATLGEGGHSEFFLRSWSECRIIGLDADPVMIGRATERLKSWGGRYETHTGWADLFVENWPFAPPDVFLMDLGISKFHFEQSARGFSFRDTDDLDMRLDPNGGENAKDLINHMREEDLANLIFEYGQERYSRRIARAIVRAREGVTIKTADHLARIIFQAVPAAARKTRLHPATRSFQALRIAVNQELIRLERVLKYVPDILSAGGCMAIISFHSLEDRMVKQAFRALDAERFIVMTRKPVRPGVEEMRINPSSRSSRLRVIRHRSSNL